MLKDILLVPSITKNLISISKLTTDNNLFVEFIGNVGYVKDLLKKQVLLQGLAEKWLYKLLLKPSQSFASSFLCQSPFIKPLSMLSACYFNSHVQTASQNNIPNFVSSCDTSMNSHVSTKSLNNVTLCNKQINIIVLYHRRFGHPNQQILMYLLKNVHDINLSSMSVNQALKHICEAC